MAGTALLVLYYTGGNKSLKSQNFCSKTARRLHICIDALEWRAKPIIDHDILP